MEGGEQKSSNLLYEPKPRAPSQDEDAPVKIDKKLSKQEKKALKKKLEQARMIKEREEKEEEDKEEDLVDMPSLKAKRARDSQSEETGSVQ